MAILFKKKKAYQSGGNIDTKKQKYSDRTYNTASDNLKASKDTQVSEEGKKKLRELAIKANAEKKKDSIPKKQYGGLMDFAVQAAKMMDLKNQKNPHYKSDVVGIKGGQSINKYGNAITANQANVDANSLATAAMGNQFTTAAGQVGQELGVIPTKLMSWEPDKTFVTQYVNPGKISAYGENMPIGRLKGQSGEDYPITRAQFIKLKAVMPHILQDSNGWMNLGKYFEGK